MNRTSSALAATLSIFPLALMAQNQDSTSVPASAWTIGYKEGGGGFFLQSPDENFRLRLLGYVQAVQKIYASTAYDKVRADYPLNFLVRRARMDVGATLYKDYDVFLEWDAAPITMASGPSSQNPDARTEVTSTFALVEAKVSSRILGDHLQLTMGKFTVPFSAEAIRSGRAYDTVERYMALSAMAALPTIDVQYGLMLSGKELNQQLEWYLSVANGNAKASRNTDEDNGSKEYTARLVHHTESLSLGISVDSDAAATDQTLRLSDLTGTGYYGTRIYGPRLGYSPDILFRQNAFSFRAEYLNMHWDRANVNLDGGFAQLSYFVYGDQNRGFKPLLRWETARIRSEQVDRTESRQLSALTAGWQWFLNPSTRNQFNVIATQAGRSIESTVYNTEKPRYAVLNEFQIKF